MSLSSSHMPAYENNWGVNIVSPTFMDDHLQLRHAINKAESERYRESELKISYNASSESCTFEGFLNGAHHLGDSGTSDMTDMTAVTGSGDAGDKHYTTVLLREDKRKSSFQFVCPSCYNFFTSYRSANADQRVTPFAVVLLFVLFLVYVLNQADRLVLPVVIPDGLRCDPSRTQDCHTNSTNSSTSLADSYFDVFSNHNGSGAIPETNTSNSSQEDCIHFSDAQQGYLTGPVFTVVYVIAGLPLARLADTRSRSLVLLVGLSFWSVMVFLNGFVTQFWQLLLLRLFLGIGEASCNPVAYSLIADVFPSRHRAFALSVYHYGVYLGGGLGWLIGSINQLLSWRWTFRILGISSMVLLPVAMLALWEPKSMREQRKARRKGKQQYSIKEVLLFLFKSPPFWMLLAAGSIRNIPGYALGAWLPTFFVRQFGVDAGHYAVPVGVVVVLGGGLGSFLGGFISDRMSSYWKNSKPYVIAVSQVLAAPSIAAVLLAPSPEASYGFLFLAYLTAETWLGPAAAILQDICMPAMRAQASAVYVGVITIVASIGPVLVPAFTDHIGAFDPCTKGIGYALLALVPAFYLIAAVLFTILGVVMQCWDRVLAAKAAKYDVFENERCSSVSAVKSGSVLKQEG